MNSTLQITGKLIQEAFCKYNVLIFSPDLQCNSERFLRIFKSTKPILAALLMNTIK